MRVAIVAESYLPHMNGVTNSVIKVCQELTAAGHDVMIIAPESPEDGPGASAVNSPAGVPVLRLASRPLPGYPQVRVVLVPAVTIAEALSDFGADVVHLASPFLLGWQALVAAQRLGIATVAIYQTDVISYTAKYGVAQAEALVARHVARLHKRATLTLAPSSHAEAQLRSLDVDRLRRWGRGVDTVLFSPSKRDETWRAEIAPGKKIIGYIGRLAAEKQVADLACLQDIDGAQLVIVGDGPELENLRATLPRAVFTGNMPREQIARAFASFDVFVHAGESETFGQTLQEAHASGVPVVAVGRGGPVDLVRSSTDGWLYEPGNLADLEARVRDLIGDDTKRAAFAENALAGVHHRTWAALTARLVGYYEEAIGLARFTHEHLPGTGRRPDTAALTPRVPTAWRRYIALGDSFTEGMSDQSRVADGTYRGWADRLAELLAQHVGGGGSFDYANLAVRSRRIRDLRDQVSQALVHRPDLVSVLMGSNDLVHVFSRPRRLARQLAAQVDRLRQSGADVLLVTPFLPRRRATIPLRRKFAIYASALREIAEAQGCLLLDIALVPEVREPRMFADDRVHLRSRAHRLLAYRAAEILGVPDSVTLAQLEDAFHDDEPSPAGWVRRDVLPWMWRRVRGRRAGDGRMAKHAAPVPINLPLSHATPTGANGQTPVEPSHPALSAAVSDELRAAVGEAAGVPHLRPGEGDPRTSDPRTLDPR